MDERAFRVDDLRLAIKRLLDAVEFQHGPTLAFDVDHYWNVPVSKAFDPHNQPGLDFGQVSDDVEAVFDLAHSAEDDTVAVWHECEHLAGVLRAIAQLDIGKS